MFDLAGLQQAKTVVYGAMPPTPQYRWPGLSRRVGCEVWVKHENHTRPARSRFVAASSSSTN